MANEILPTPGVHPAQSENPNLCVCGTPSRTGRCATCAAKACATNPRWLAKCYKGSPARLAAGRARADRALAWCPAELRDEYRRLKNSYRFSAAEARRIILEQAERGR